MAKIFLNNFLRFTILILLQVAVLKNMGFYNVAVVFPYLLIIFLLPIGVPNWLIFVLSFASGLTVDAFYDSIGIHAAACTALALFRIFFHNITLENDDKESFITPTWGNMGFKWYSTYILLGTLFHHIVFFMVETFSLQNLFQTLLSILLSTVCTVIVIFILSLLTYKTKSRAIS